MHSSFRRLALASMFCLASPVAAAPTVYTFSGTATASTIAGSANTFSGSFNYDPSVSATCGSYTGPGYYGGTYCGSAAVTNFTFTSGTATTTSSTPSADLTVFNNYKSYATARPADGFTVHLEGYQLSNGFTEIDFNLIDSTATAFGTATNPASLTLAVFDYPSVTVYGPDFARFDGTITTLTGASVTVPAVPEVATWAMTILGMGAIGFAMRRQKVATRGSYAA